MKQEDGTVVPLTGEQISTPPSPLPTRSTSTLHTASVAGMALSAFVGIAAMLAFITVSWPGNSGRYVIAVCVAATISFMACASIAVFAAARDSYRGRGPRGD